MVTLCCNDGMTKVETRRARLRMLIAEHGLSELAEKTGKPASQLNDMAAGRKSFGEKIADQLTAKIGLPGGWFELWIGEKFTNHADASGQTGGAISETSAQGVGDSAPNPPHERDYALIPQYHVSGECGSGYLNGHEEVKGGLAFKRDWLARMSLKPDSLSVIYACGLSMAPTINEGEVLLVDHDQSEPRDGQVFAFERDGELLIKRLVRHPAGSWICRSDNPDKIRYADWEPVSTDQLGLLRIVGRIVWRGGAM